MSTRATNVGTVGTALLALAVAAGCGGDAPEPEASEQPAEEARATTSEAEGGAGILSDDHVRQSVEGHIIQGGETITVSDPLSDSNVRLTFDHVHEEVKTTEGGRRYVCVDFTGPNGTVYDVDYYVDEEGGTLQFEDRLIHQVGPNDVVADSVRARLNSAS